MEYAIENLGSKFTKDFLLVLNLKLFNHLVLLVYADELFYDSTTSISSVTN